MDYVYRMTWSEFMIRLHAFKRCQVEEWKKVRAISYQVYISNWMSKKKPKTIENYMPLDSKKKKVLSDKIKERIKQAQAQYIKDQQKNG